MHDITESISRVTGSPRPTTIPKYSTTLKPSMGKKIAAALAGLPLFQHPLAERSLLQRALLQRVFLKRMLRSSSAASVLSLLMLFLRCRREGVSMLRGVNAVSHWLWGDRALKQNGASWRYTAAGTVIHHLSSVFWGTLFAAIAPRQPKATPVKAATVAAATTALAWAVDYHLTPRRLTPGFENVISRKSRVWVYAAFATGLALGAVQLSRKSHNDS